MAMGNPLNDLKNGCMGNSMEMTIVNGGCSVAMFDSSWETEELIEKLVVFFTQPDVSWFATGKNWILKPILCILLLAWLN